MADGVALPASGVSVLTDELVANPYGAPGNQHAQAMKIIDGTAAGTTPLAVDVNGRIGTTIAAVDTSSGFVPVTPAMAGTGTPSNVAASATNVTLKAASAARKSILIYNDSTANLYILTAAGTATVSNFSFLLAPGGVYEDYGYTGIISGLWATATGNARVTERT